MQAHVGERCVNNPPLGLMPYQPSARHSCSTPAYLAAFCTALQFDQCSCLCHSSTNSSFQLRWKNVSLLVNHSAKVSLECVLSSDGVVQLRFYRLDTVLDNPQQPG